MKNKSLRRAAALLLAVGLALSLALPAMAAEEENSRVRTVVRVAFYQLDGFFEYDENGEACGYGVDFLNELSKYADLTWEYVPVDSWEDIGPMLRDGRVDLRMPVSEPATPSQMYDYTVEPVLSSYHAIMTLADRADLYYQDYENFPKLRIAAVPDLLEKTGMADYLASIGVLDNILYFDDYNSCRRALDEGRADALISNVMDLTDDMKILDKFSVVNNYITTLKGSVFYGRINNALTRMKLENPSFQSELYEQYFPQRTVEPYTRAESDYIASTAYLTVAVYPDRKPVTYLDADGEYRGIAIDLAELLSEKMGIPFRYVPVTTDTTVKMLETADLVMPVPQELDDTKYFATGSILDSEVLLAVRSGTETVEKGDRVGVLDTTPGIRATMEGLDSFEIVQYQTSRAALNALQRGEIEAVANSSYVLNWMLENPRYENIGTLRYQRFPLSYEICGKAEDTELQSVLNKAVRQLHKQDVDEILQKNTKLGVLDFTWSDRVYVYRVQILCGLALLAVLGTWAVLYNRSRSKYIRQIQESSRKQEEASRTKSEFLARMSHDMRTPLNVILGMGHLARENENPPDTNDCLDKINISSEFLLGLINDVLDMERLESGKMVFHLQPYSGEEFRRYIESVIQPLCDQNGVRFVYTVDSPGDFVLMQDKLRTNQVYCNLLGNAAKFTPAGGTITFHTKVEKTDHGTAKLRVTVADTGIGMSEEFMRQMFEPFTQESRECKPVSDGTGLGLSIVKRICDGMGMTIDVQSEIGKGTTFTLGGEFALAETAPAPAAPAAVDHKVLQGRTVLVCEDHPLNREIIRRLLEKAGVQVMLAENGQLGVDAFAASAPGSVAAVLMDIRMPVMDGLQATRAIRALPRPDAAGVPILALTANAYEADVQNCLEAGMNAHLAKPIDPASLYAALAKAVTEGTYSAPKTTE